MPTYSRLAWANTTALRSREFKCGFCGNQVASTTGYFAHEGNAPGAELVICHLCTRPTLFEIRGRRVPAVAFGNPVSDIPEQAVSDLYEEARRATSTGAYTAAVLCCRKLLMHIAVDKGAAPGLSFLKYVEHLADKNYIPPDAKPWVDHIRTKSNEANHEITMMSQSDAEELVEFCEILLKIIFEFPAAIKQRHAKHSS